MRVLITGVAGFVGGHVADYFKKKGWDVCGIDNLTDYELKREFDVKKVRKHNLDYLKKIKCKFAKADCRTITATELKKYFGEIDYIIHCAAQPTMTLAIEDPKYDADDNIISVVNMLLVARYFNCPFANCSSIHVYGNKLNNKLKPRPTRFTCIPAEIKETTKILRGELTPLHVSKRSTELYVQCFSETYGLRACSFRLTGMFGERQFGGMDHGWVANFAIRTIIGRPLTVFGTDKQVRDILYASDVSRAFEMWYYWGKSKIYNIGGGMENSISINECLRELRKITKKKQTIKKLPKRKGDLWYFVCDYKTAYKDFGWKPLVSPKEGLKRICKWIKKNKKIM